jgi:hypothetical protein
VAVDFGLAVHLRTGEVKAYNNINNLDDTHGFPRLRYRC